MNFQSKRAWVFLAVCLALAATPVTAVSRLLWSEIPAACGSCTTNEAKLKYGLNQLVGGSIRFFDLEGKTISITSPIVPDAAEGNYAYSYYALQNGVIKATGSAWGASTKSVNCNVAVGSTALSGCSASLNGYQGAIADCNELPAGATIRSVSGTSGQMFSAPLKSKTSAAISLTRYKFMIDLSSAPSVRKLTFIDVTFNGNNKASGVLATENVGRLMNLHRVTMQNIKGVAVIADTETTISDSSFDSNENALLQQQRKSIGAVMITDSKVLGCTFSGFKHSLVSTGNNLIARANIYDQSTTSTSTTARTHTAAVVIHSGTPGATFTSSTFKDGHFQLDVTSRNGWIVEGLVVAKNTFTVDKAKSTFRFIVLRSEIEIRLGHFSLVDNSFATTNGNIDRIDGNQIASGVTQAIKWDDRLIWERNSINNGITRLTCSPCEGSYSKPSAYNYWYFALTGKNMPFDLGLKSVVSEKNNGVLKSDGSSGDSLVPQVLYTSSNDRINFYWNQNTQGGVKFWWRPIAN